MRAECIDAVNVAAGRKLTQQETKGIEQRIRDAKKFLASKDRGRWQTLPEAARLTEAAAQAAKDLNAEAKLKKYRVALTVLAHDKVNKEWERLIAEGYTGTDAIGRLNTTNYDGQTHARSLEQHIKDMENYYAKDMVKAFTVTNPKIFGLFTNVEGIKAFAYEVKGQGAENATKNKELIKAAKEGAAVWKSGTDTMRKTFNNLGGKIGFLEDWDFPQSHAISKMLPHRGRIMERLKGAIDQPAFQKAWVDFILPHLKREKYLNEDGSLMDDAAVKDMLMETWHTIVTGGANKQDPGKVTGTGARANAHSKSRALHFKDADSWLAYHAEYGSGDMYSMLVGHVHKMARDIALVEQRGPNPHAVTDYFFDKAEKHDKTNLIRTGTVDSEIAKERNRYDMISGRQQPPASEALHNAFAGYRRWRVASALGSAFISSIPDNITMHLTAHYNNMSHIQLMKNQFAELRNILPGEKFTDKERVALQRNAALALDYFNGAMNRYGEDTFASFTGKAASLTIRASGLQAITDARRAAFGTLMYGSLGMSSRKYKTIADLPFHDKRLMETKGISEESWQVWRAAQLEDWGGGNNKMLTPAAIQAAQGFTDAQKRKATLDLIGAVQEEMDMAIIMPGVRERQLANLGTQSGTWLGEITRSVFVFKGFPISVMYRHWQRGFKSDMSPVSKAAYMSMFVAGSTFAGAASVQLYELINGRDPLEMDNGAFWTQAFLKGGSFGVYGDFVLQANSSYGNTPLGVLGGPIVSSVEDLINLTQGNLVALAQGKDTNFWPEFVRNIKQNVPLQNLWYTRAVTDRLIFGNLQDMMEPGYMRRIQRKSERDYDKSYFIPLDTLEPDRAPDFARAVGQ